MKKSITTLLLLASIICFSQSKPDTTAVLKDTLTFVFPKELAETFDQVLFNKDYSHKKYLQLIQLWQAQIPGLYKKKKP